MLGRAGTLVPLCGQQQQQARGMATLKAISIRLKSVKNIQKITQSMKMVSAAKYTKAERELKQARPYGEGAKQFYEKAEVAPVGEAPKKLVIAMTSDRGLCGAVHTQVSRSIRTELTEDPENTKIICVGDKSRAILQRLYGKNIIGVANEVGRKPPTFTDAAKLTNIILNSGYEFTAGRIVYNRFKSVVSYTTTDLPLFSLEAIQAAPKLPVYDSLDSEVLQSYLEYSIASLIFYAMKEGACSEQSSRMTAMDNASKNAGEMIDKLTLTFNRTRQAVITRELIEIISGAAALD
ncbi:ATP synthase subunit gamma, mitochondrial [Schistocerca americana]|uniref:ATP synthase subunit gamma, mitochondrial n=1 Tax=Schistocerca americana TaxID=7009 RepID=UPI001F4FF137|nr:ATP synthase subunit gamma, mitochondrial [Schistocerca americana]XP_047097196.1 ATP synthase subunit gamma, mitochondrial [Schistocerca piceifrons]XP_049767285.1 ATP synthase subunit gamma, mitochondrial [Schistocerca cancellata]XP_049793649.1 ATP synthase subunit gamma, mitochondrial [Schistocerca nitens]XP_049840778.1 ATP synthase subunit gamma, mitochondrial [Schistocerca gregaria]XP_049942068.1 ATP synthase subunit gamma, mitochondrial [Schistocerca serialis cubense]